jgi:hypothetical protein
VRARWTARIRALAKSENLVGVVAAATAMTVAYAPTLLLNYVPQDQWRAFGYSVPARSALFRLEYCVHLPRFFFSTGRPFVWIGECIEHVWVARIGDFAALRPLCLLTSIALVLALAYPLREIFRSYGIAAMASAIVLLTPGFGFMYMQGLTAWCVVLGAIAAALSLPFIDQTFEHFLAQDRRGAFRPALLGAILFLFALCNYAQYAFLILAVIPVLFAFGRDETLQLRTARLLWRFGCYGALCLTYYAGTKIVGALIPQGRPFGDAQHAFAMDLGPRHLLGKLGELANYAATMPLGPWGTSSLLYVLLLTGGAIVIRAVAPTKSASALSIAFLLAILLPTVAIVLMAPWLVSAFIGIPARESLPLEVMVVLTGCSAIFATPAPRIIRIAIVLALLACSSFVTFSETLNEVRNSQAEIGYMRAAIANLAQTGRLDTLPQFHVIRVAPGNTYTGAAYSDGEAAPATMMNTAHIFQMFTAIVREYRSDQQLAVHVFVDCQFDRSCVQQRVAGSTVVSQANDDGGLLLPGAAVLDYRRLAKPYPLSTAVAFVGTLAVQRHMARIIMMVMAVSAVLTAMLGFACMARFLDRPGEQT